MSYQTLPTNYVEALEALLQAEKEKERLKLEIEQAKSMQSASEFPPVLKASHIATIMGISAPTAYELMRHKDFPLLEGEGVKRVLRDSFFNWLKSKERKSG